MDLYPNCEGSDMAVVQYSNSLQCDDHAVARAWSHSPQRAHLVGIGGSGMRSLASVLLDAGWKLTGSDQDPHRAESLRAERIPVFDGHAAIQLPSDVDMVVRSDAVPSESPELQAATFLGIPVYSYFAMLGRLVAAGRGLAVAGTHGKSSTTGMAAAILTAAGLDPTVVFGAAPLGQPFGGRLGHSPWVLVEACEYRANFLHLQPEKAVILGVEPDHFDYYRSLEQLQGAFDQFALQVRPDGWLLVRHECDRARKAAGIALAEVETFGYDDAADWSARDLRQSAGCYRFALHHRRRLFAEICLQVPGRHNVLNATAAAALAYQCGAAPQAIAAALAQFPGLERRMESMGNWRGVDVLDDYAHHPTEVSAALQTVREMYPGRRVWCVFQPHQVSRTTCLLDELAASLDNSDRLYVSDIFRAREPRSQEREITAADLAVKLRQRGKDVGSVHELPAIFSSLQNELAPGDVLITLGAGDIRTWTEAFLAQ
jgi:UDP-N-acetylmuramate--alanine ligase